MNLARRIGKLEAIPERVPVPDRHDPHAMRVFAEGLVAAERWEGARRLARLVWVKRGRPDLADAAAKGDLEAVEAALASVTEEERAGMRAAAEVLLMFLEGTDGDADDRRVPGPLLA